METKNNREEIKESNIDHKTIELGNKEEINKKLGSMEESLKPQSSNNVNENKQSELPKDTNGDSIKEKTNEGNNDAKKAEVSIEGKEEKLDNKEEINNKLKSIEESLKPPEASNADRNTECKSANDHDVKDTKLTGNEQGKNRDLNVVDKKIDSESGKSSEDCATNKRVAASSDTVKNESPKKWDTNNAEIDIKEEPQKQNVETEDTKKNDVTDNKQYEGTNNVKNPVIDNMKTRLPNDQLNSPSRRGNAPISKIDNNPVEIHHEGQKPDGPFHEMTKTDHRRGENYKKNHPDYDQPSKIDRKEFDKQKKEYWKNEWDDGRWDE
jgi:hypothetical protein